MEGFVWLVLKAAFDTCESLDSAQARLEHQANLIADLGSALKLFRMSNETNRQEMIYFLCNFLSGGIDHAVTILPDHE
jgi:hypothetical protein